LILKSSEGKKKPNEGLQLRFTGKVGKGAPHSTPNGCIYPIKILCML
jgi:hypothetical protein